MMHRVTRIFLPKISVPLGKERGKEVTSTSQKLLADLGLVTTANATGTNVLLPLAVRSLEKLKKLLKEKLNKVGAQELVLPVLVPLKLMETTNRHLLPELFKLRDRHKKDLILSPTHEETIAYIISQWSKPSYKHFPLFLYQIGNKFRDEMKPRFGLMRSREFLMKDLYTFDTSAENAMNSYNLIMGCYKKFFDSLKVPYACVEGCSGDIGGSLSHEFHLLSKIGEDKLIICRDCQHGNNETHCKDNTNCSNCGSKLLEHSTGIEVGHSFLLGTKYTDPLKALFNGPDNKPHPLHMTCHGIGLTRLLAASVEVLSNQSEVKWPDGLAPYTICIISPKEGSKEENSSLNIDEFQKSLCDQYPDEVLLDDRTDLTIGKRFQEAKCMGYPFIIVLGKSSLLNPPQIEVYDTSRNKVSEHNPVDVFNILRSKLLKY